MRFLALGAGVRPLAYYLLIGGLAMNLCTDVVYAVQSTLGTYVGGLIVWNFNYQVAVPKTDEKWAFSMLRENWSPRPAFTALSQLPKV